MSDLDGRCFLRRGNALVPADEMAEEFLSTIADGREIIISVRKARSPQHHRWFWKMLSLVVENTDDKWGGAEDLLEDLKFATGHVRRKVNPFTGEVSIIAKSINFASMDENAFRRFRDRCLYVIERSTGISAVSLMEEVDGKRNAA